MSLPTTSDLSLQQELLKEILREETRKEKRNLLAASAVGIVIVKAGLIPTKISALGIDFSQADQRTFLLVLLGITAYFLLVFVVYALTDIWAFRFSLQARGEEHLLKHTRLPNDTLSEHVWWRDGKKHTQQLDILISEEAQSKHHEWMFLIHQMLEQKPEREKKVEELLEALKAKGKILDECEETRQALDTERRAELLELGRRVRDFLAEGESQWAAAEEMRLEANRIMQRDARQRDELFKALFRFTGIPTLLSLARIGIDFLLPIAISVFAIVSLARGH